MYNKLFLDSLSKCPVILNKSDDDQNLEQLENFKPKMNFMYYKYQLSALITCLKEDFNVIFSYSPLRKSPISSDFLGKKRIQQLTPPINSKVLAFSPYKKSSFTPIKNSLMSKDLSEMFNNKN